MADQLAQNTLHNVLSYVLSSWNKKFDAMKNTDCAASQQLHLAALITVKSVVYSLLPRNETNSVLLIFLLINSIRLTWSAIHDLIPCQYSGNTLVSWMFAFTGMPQRIGWGSNNFSEDIPWIQSRTRYWQIHDRRCP
ncbi:hypothetical protein DAPPUDRAFT_116316 [Daphnia pulex]|uniref:Uncharacterized protein n=1 Tax=Daphnia pulex TaxID=6669 RepID=E9HP09_DAPPU|nr:hypothetical protein DAPPUDRAFT_116316 [Daphnia pulex]|eukprot:EFX66526.1 hypothetical protein DAPPUDRAFT_116316 [Daphnia pulex]